MAGIQGTSIPFVKQQWFDLNGKVAAGHYLFVYGAGTTQKATTYSDKGLTTTTANPVVLDSAGRASLFLDPAVTYKILLSINAEDPPNCPIWSFDGIHPADFYAVSITEQRDGNQTYWEAGTSQFENVLELHAPYNPVILHSEYEASTGSTDDIDIPAGTLASDLIVSDKGDGLVLEWEVDQTSANLEARATVFGTDVDLGCGAASTMTRARFTILRESNTNVRVDQMVEQNTGSGNAQVALATQSIGSLNLTTTDYTVAMLMVSGTYTIRAARAYYVRGFVRWETP